MRLCQTVQKYRLKSPSAISESELFLKYILPISIRAIAIINEREILLKYVLLLSILLVSIMTTGLIMLEGILEFLTDQN